MHYDFVMLCLSGHADFTAYNMHEKSQGLGTNIVSTLFD